jgi:hypothetical protein
MLTAAAKRIEESSQQRHVQLSFADRGADEWPKTPSSSARQRPSTTLTKQGHLPFSLLL